MPSQYPVALDNLPANYVGTDQADVVDHAGMHNDERDAINAVQAELGTDPSGAAATVRARLDAIDADGRWTNSRTPTAHKTSHAIGGSDPLTPADIGAATAAQGMLADTAVQPAIGSGAPEGVRVASPGATWTQTDHPAANGLLVWRKDSGNGSTGWVVEKGDTGWRLCTVSETAVLSNTAFNAANPGAFVYLRRRDDRVDFNLYVPNNTFTAAYQPAVSLPSGFRPASTGTPSARVLAPLTYPAIDVATLSPTVPASGLYFTANVTANLLTTGGWTSGKTMNIYGSFFAAPSTWPTSAPGT